MSSPLPSPEAWDEHHLACAPSKRALGRIQKIALTFGVLKDYIFSRAAALEMAKKLILVSSEDEATRLLQSDQSGTMSFWLLSNDLKGFLTDGGVSAEGAAEQSLPYYLLCSWLIDQEAKVNRYWKKDTDPFSDRKAGGKKY